MDCWLGGYKMGKAVGGLPELFLVVELFNVA